MKNYKYLAAVLAGCLFLGGCSNGGGSSAVVTATPTPLATVTATPTPAPTETPTPTSSINIKIPYNNGKNEDESVTQNYYEDNPDATPIPVVSYNFEAKVSGEETEGLTFVKNLRIGWNLGNTFEAFTDRNQYADDELKYESSWVGVKTSREMIKMLKDKGFNSIRIPVSWHNHVSGENHEISKVWLDRVNEVVDWAIDEGMYVILNTHHDVYNEYYYPDMEHMDSSVHYMRCIWTQLSERFKDYDNHLIFESLNEPRLKDNQFEWNMNTKQQIVVDAIEVINRMNQEFVDTVRESGGNNAGRFLMVPGYDASPEGALTSLFRLPEDPANDRLIISVHAYTPYIFALAGPEDNRSISNFDASSKSSTNDIDWFMSELYKKFISNNIPVIIGEMGARDKKGNTADRTQWAGYYVALARSYGMSCLWWDNNAFKSNGEDFGILDRKNLSWKFEDIINALMANCD